jgi:hypothetical protein
MVVPLQWEGRSAYEALRRERKLLAFDDGFKHRDADAPGMFRAPRQVLQAVGCDAQTDRHVGLGQAKRAGEFKGIEKACWLRAPEYRASVRPYEEGVNYTSNSPVRNFLRRRSGKAPTVIDEAVHPCTHPLAAALLERQ